MHCLITAMSFIISIIMLISSLLPHFVSTLFLWLPWLW
uniref:Uncharacterized protein n=1 Tax=Anguilla anguilla TaxID=7936 RepID=A0A0E9PRT4_ANGAN